MPKRILYSIGAVSTGDGPNGHVTTSDSGIDLDLAMPPELAGTGEGHETGAAVRLRLRRLLPQRDTAGRPFSSRFPTSLLAPRGNSHRRRTASARTSGPTAPTSPSNYRSRTS
jgi:hypothetical protein